jgi:hypothetical protein
MKPESTVKKKSLFSVAFLLMRNTIRPSAKQNRVDINEMKANAFMVLFSSRHVYTGPYSTDNSAYAKVLKN